MTTWLIPEGLDHASQTTERNRLVFKFIFAFIDDLCITCVCLTGNSYILTARKIKAGAGGVSSSGASDSGGFRPFRSSTRKSSTTRDVFYRGNRRTRCSQGVILTDKFLSNTQYIPGRDEKGASLGSYHQMSLRKHRKLTLTQGRHEPGKSEHPLSQREEDPTKLSD